MINEPMHHNQQHLAIVFPVEAARSLVFLVASPFWLHFCLVNNNMVLYVCVVYLRLSLTNFKTCRGPDLL